MVMFIYMHHDGNLRQRDSCWRLGRKRAFLRRSLGQLPANDTRGAKAFMFAHRMEDALHEVWRGE
jgi:hypothetical protein